MKGVAVEDQDLPAHLANLERQETKEDVVIRVHKEPVASRVLLDNQDPLVYQVPPVHPALQVSMVVMDSRVPQEIQAHQANLESPDHLETMAKMVNQDKMVQRDQQAPKDPKDSKDQREKQEKEDNKAHRVLQVQPVLKE